jgi:hypothetical protein
VLLEDVAVSQRDLARKAPSWVKVIENEIFEKKDLVGFRVKMASKRRSS